MPLWPWSLNRIPTIEPMPTPKALAAKVSAEERGYVVPSDEAAWGLMDKEPTPELRWPENIEVYDRMRRQDAQVISVLRAVTLPIRRTQWRVDPAGASPEVTNFVAQNLGLPVVGVDETLLPRGRDRFSWSEHLYLALLCLPFGHSIFEQVYRIENNRAWLRKLGWRPPRTISKIDVAPDGGLVAIEQHSSGSKKHRMTVDRLVVYVNEREGGNWLGQSLLRACYRPWLLKDRLLRVQTQSVDRNGMGVPLYEASPAPKDVPLTAAEYTTRQTDEMTAGLKIARGLRSGDSAGAAIPSGAKVSLLGVQGTLPDSGKPVAYHDEQIARAVLAHFLNLGSETGSWALGSTFADFFTLSLQTVALMIADTATQHIVEDLVELNFGPDMVAPRIVFDEIGSHKHATAEALKILVDCGAVIPDDKLEQFMRQTYSLPEKDPATTREPVEQQPTPATAELDGGAQQ